jgi:arginase
MMKAKIAVLDAPSNLGLRPPRPNHLPGVWRLPAALRANGLIERLDADDAGSVHSPEYSDEPDQQTGFRNGPKIAAYAKTLANRVTPLLREGRFPLILGGDCSILLGNLLALRSLGSYGLCFIDGHNDFAYPKSSSRFGFYTAAGLDLSLVTGYGPAGLVNIDGMGPYVEPANVVALGFYEDPADAADYKVAEFYQTDIQPIDIDKIRSMGAQPAACLALQRLENSSLKGFWIHLDADVLDQSILPAVDSPNPRGLTYPELGELLRVLLESERAIGMDITIFDPELDPNGRYAAELVAAIIQAFKRSNP